MEYSYFSSIIDRTGFAGFEMAKVHGLYYDCVRMGVGDFIMIGASLLLGYIVEIGVQDKG
jgi:hypothetical protein